MPETKELVINTTPILVLIAAAGSLDMLSLLYRRVWVPLEVCREIRAGGTDGFAIPEFERASWLHKQTQPVALSALLRNSLDPGEAAVIQLALVHDIPLVAIDETVGRRFACLSGLTVTGSSRYSVARQDVGLSIVHERSYPANEAARHLAER